MNLASIHGLKFMGGRAVSAPEMRTTSRPGVTMAETHNSTTEEESMPLNSVTMPHNVLDKRSLEEQHPSLEVAKDVGDQDVLQDEDDMIIEAGHRARDEIIEAARTYGRRRRMS